MFHIKTENQIQRKSNEIVKTYSKTSLLFFAITFQFFFLLKPYELNNNYHQSMPLISFNT